VATAAVSRERHSYATHQNQSLAVCLGPLDSEDVGACDVTEVNGNGPAHAIVKVPVGPEERAREPCMGCEYACSSEESGWGGRTLLRRPVHPKGVVAMRGAVDVACERRSTVGVAGGESARRTYREG
jgi:hypothetical protein